MARRDRRSERGPSSDVPLDPLSDLLAPPPGLARHSPVDLELDRLATELGRARLEQERIRRDEFDHIVQRNFMNLEYPQIFTRHERIPARKRWNEGVSIDWHKPWPLATLNPVAKKMKYCTQREIRREVLHAKLLKTGKGSKVNYRKKPREDSSCR